MALLTWMIVYPMITLLLASLDLLLHGLAMPLRTLVLTAIMVSLMVYLAMPFATRRLGPWPGSANDFETARPGACTKVRHRCRLSLCAGPRYQ